jgi:hypothetical protein
VGGAHHAELCFAPAFPRQIMVYPLPLSVATTASAVAAKLAVQDFQGCRSLDLQHSQLCYHRCRCSLRCCHRLE